MRKFLTDYTEGLIFSGNEIKPAVKLVMGLLENQIERVDFMRDFPLVESLRLLELAIESVSCGVDLPISVPVCPDYQAESGYDDLGCGVSRTALRFLDRFPLLSGVFSKRGIKIKAEMDFADVEILDPFLGRRLNLNKDEFFSRVAASRNATKQEIASRGLADKIEVGSMLNRFQDNGIDYAVRQHQFADQILSDYSLGKNRKVKLTLNALIKERTKIGDYQTLKLSSDSEYLEVAAYELAGYAVYGELIGPDALICSPDAESAIPGYNFLKKDRSTISPTAFIKPLRRGHGSLFFD